MSFWGPEHVIILRHNASLWNGIDCRIEVLGSGEKSNRRVVHPLEGSFTISILITKDVVMYMQSSSVIQRKSREFRNPGSLGDRRDAPNR